MELEAAPTNLGNIPQCPKCKAFHTDNTTGRWIAKICATFDPDRPCRICAQPVCGLSMGGPDICPLCDMGYPIPRSASG